MENRASNGREVGKHHEMFWMAKTEALISAVERRCIRAIERACTWWDWPVWISIGSPWNLGHSVLAKNSTLGI
jgi:hypothetical protein